MVESPLITELLAGAETKTKSEVLLRVVQKSFQEVAVAIRGCQDGDQLARWLDAALDADLLAKFRQQTGL